MIVETDYSYVDKKGEKNHFIEHHYVVFWNGLAQKVLEYVNIGDNILIEGRNQSHIWYEEDSVKGQVERKDVQVIAERYIGL